MCEFGYQDIDDDGDCEKGRKITDNEKIAFYYLELFLLLACTACTGANRECKDGDCVCENGYQEIDCIPRPTFGTIIRCECEKGRKIKDIEKIAIYHL